MLGEKIKDYRLEKGLSQEELATALGVVRQTVSKWEKELSLPESEMLLKIAEVLGTTAADLLDEQPLPPAEEKSPRRLKAWEIVLLALGSPIWLSLGIAALAVAVALYAVVWSVIISLWAVFAALVSCAAGGVVAGNILAFTGSVLPGMATVAAGLVCAGLSVFAFFGCKMATKVVLIWSRKIAGWIKNRIFKKEKANG